MADWMCCSACDGHGRVLLSEEAPQHAELLEWLREDKPEGATAVEASETFTCETGYAAAYRKDLNELRTWGFVEREKRGRSWVYRAKEGGRDE